MSIYIFLINTVYSFINILFTNPDNMSNECLGEYLNLRGMRWQDGSQNS
jgi:hypothetical protein